MKHAIIATIAIALLAAGPAIAQENLAKATASKADAAMTTRIRDGKQYKVTNDWDSAEYCALRAEIAAKPVIGLTTNEAKFVCATFTTFVTNDAERARLLPTLKALADGDHPVSGEASGKYVMLFAKADEIDKYAAKVTGRDLAWIIKRAALRLSQPEVFTGWCAANRAKGVTSGAYRQQWLADFEAAQPGEKIMMARQEIAALANGRNPVTDPKAETWLRELRLRLMVAREIQAE